MPNEGGVQHEGRKNLDAGVVEPVDQVVQPTATFAGPCPIRPGQLDPRHDRTAVSKLNHVGKRPLEAVVVLEEGPHGEADLRSGLDRASSNGLVADV
jgi:hypothetical protein